MAEEASVQADISPITAAASVYALLTLTMWEKSQPSNTRCSSPVRERRSELPSLTDSGPDALIGYGLKSAPVGGAVRLIEWANASGAPILALDIPSGRNATTGEAPTNFLIF